MNRIEKKRKLLGETSIGKLLFKMSYPATIGMLVMTLYNVVDAIFIGKYVGSLGLAAVSIVFPLMILIIALSVSFGMGSSSLISLNLGKKNLEKANLIFNNFIFLISFLSLSILILSYLFIDKILILLGANSEIFNLAKNYFIIIIFGYFFQMFAASSNGIIRAEGAAKLAMGSMLIGGITNIILDYLFLVIYNLGIEGVAFATLISQFLQFIYVLWFFLTKSILKFSFKDMFPNSKILFSIISLGFPSFIRQSSMSFVGILTNNLLNIYGTVLDIAAYGIMFRVMMITIMPAMGILQGTQPIVGFNYGAEKFRRVKDVLKLSIKSSILIIFLIYLIIMIYPEIFIKLFTNEQNLIKITKEYIRIMFLFLPLIGFQFISGGFFQAIGRVKPAMLVSLTRQVILLIPLLLIFSYFFGLYGIWIAFPITDFLSTMIIGILFKNEYSKL